MTVICSWCSTESQAGTVQCPNCGANLVADSDVDVPGVTAVDAASIIRSKSNDQPSNPVLAWLNSEHSRAIAPPDDEVRREILRLELQAEVANLQAEADALRAEAAVEGRTLDLPDVAELTGEAADAADAPAEGGAEPGAVAEAAVAEAAGAEDSTEPPAAAQDQQPA